MIRGSCLCGSIHYTVAGPLSDFGYCHCQSCRKASGSAFGANAGVAACDLELSDPGQRLREFESSPGKFRAFCSHCGSPLYAYLARTPDLLRIRLGTLDSVVNASAKAHTFVADKADWDQISDTLPQFDAWADPDVLVQVGSRQKR